MDPELAALLTDTVQHAPYVGQDAYGKATYGPAVARPARVEYRTEMSMAGGTRAIVSETLVYFDWNFVLDERDKLTLEDGSSPSIAMIEKWKDEHGKQDYMRCHL